MIYGLDVLSHDTCMQEACVHLSLTMCVIPFAELKAVLTKSHRTSILPYKVYALSGR